MITAIDFGCRTIRAAHHSGSDPKRLTLTTERSEYAVVPLEAQVRCTLIDKHVPHAVCEDSIIVFGNHAREILWLSRKPVASLFTEGHVPTSDAPARQVLDLLCSALLPKPNTASPVCVYTVPGGIKDKEGTRFLGRLIRMQGYEPVPCSATTATILSSSVNTAFTGITVCLGAEKSAVSIHRLGAEIAAESIAIGSDWIDSELARELNLCTWDQEGKSYLDLQAVDEWKQGATLDLRHFASDRERTLSRLYAAVLDQIARTVHSLLNHPHVIGAMPDEELSVVCSGGPVQIGGFAEALNERFIEQNTAERIASVQVADDPMNAVVRGLLIHGMLEGQTSRGAA